MSTDAARAVQKGQREWLAFAERACTDDAQPRREAYGEDDVSCLEQLFSTRIGRLEENRMRSGRRVYQVDHYVVLRDPDATADAWNKVAVKEFTSPRVDGTDAEAVAFNAMMDELAATLGRLTGPSDAGADPETDAASDNQVAVTMQAATSRRISLVVSDSWYGHGAAHGNYTITYRHFLTREKRDLIASDIFAGDTWKQPLKELVLAELNRTIDGGIWPESVDLLDAAVAEPARWDFSEQGLVVQFQPYEVTAYAFGAPTVTIPWNALQPHMAADGTEIAGTY